MNTPGEVLASLAILLMGLAWFFFLPAVGLLYILGWLA